MRKNRAKRDIEDCRLVASLVESASFHPVSSILPPDVTQILHDWRGGDAEAAPRLMPLVYDELRALARRYLQQERRDHTLQATGLVHEAYLGLVGSNDDNVARSRAFFRRRRQRDAPYSRRSRPAL